MPDTCAYVMGGCGRPDCDHQHTLSECGASRAEHVCPDCNEARSERHEVAGVSFAINVMCFTCNSGGQLLGHEFTAPKEK